MEPSEKIVHKGVFAACYGGGGQGNLGGLEAETVPRHGQPQSLELIVPPLCVLVLDRTGRRSGSRC